MQRKRAAAKHASGKRVRVVDTLTAYWTLVVAWFRILIGRSTSGRHAVTGAVDGGASPEWGAVLRAMNKEPVMRPEVRA
jgi:hypothetical protein